MPQEVTTSALAASDDYVWTVSYTIIVVDPTFDSAADLYEGINEAIMSDGFEAAVEADLDVEVKSSTTTLSPPRRPAATVRRKTTALAWPP